MEAEIDVRPYSINDIPFIRSSWANSFYKGNDANKLIPPHDFHLRHRSIIDRFFMRPNATILVCCSRLDPELILGWLAVELMPSITIVHYIYVKFVFKSTDMGRQLLLKLPQDKPFVITHMTEKAAKIMAHKHDDFKVWNYLPHMS